MSTASKANEVSAVDIGSRVDACDWSRISEHLDAHGWAMFQQFLTANECAVIAGLYADDRHFRSHIVMARHGFGRGEYKYFRYPLPEKVAALRTAFYPRLAPIANRWTESMGIDVRCTVSMFFRCRWRFCSRSRRKTSRAVNPGNARHLPREPAARREPAAVRPSPHRGRDF